MIAKKKENRMNLSKGNLPLIARVDCGLVCNVRVWQFMS
jgi:hypothetical protein